jgi:hypothetical protein
MNSSSDSRKTKIADAMIQAASGRLMVAKVAAEAPILRAAFSGSDLPRRAAL